MVTAGVSKPATKSFAVTLIPFFTTGHDDIIACFSEILLVKFLFSSPDALLSKDNPKYLRDLDDADTASMIPHDCRTHHRLGLRRNRAYRR